ncbi:hypothetical protein [uncultured Roseobacter sp.]|uniref:hypothetical protein n=1 Tax=uncultured Roseobacter sp. TaxID=114847 RepID=UPI00262DE760|nr:hypothetical protein [uncultured Roseobacter sp.]
MTQQVSLAYKGGGYEEPTPPPSRFSPKAFFVGILVLLGECAALLLHGASLSKVLITDYVIPVADYFSVLAPITGDMGVEHILVGLIAAGIVFMPVFIYFMFLKARVFDDADIFDNMRLASGVALGVLGLLLVMGIELYSFYGLWLDFGNSGPFGQGKELGTLPRLLFTGVTVLIAQLFAVLTAYFTFTLTKKD